jgi:hypothetical protein
MCNEDKVGKMISRVDLVAEREEYEELLENLNSEGPETLPEFEKFRVYLFLRDICRSLKTRIEKDQDLEASLISELDFKSQTTTLDNLEELDTIITKRLSMLLQDDKLNMLEKMSMNHSETDRRRAEFPMLSLDQITEEVQNI